MKSTYIPVSQIGHSKTSENLTPDFLAPVYGCYECIFDMYDVTFRHGPGVCMRIGERDGARAID